MTNDNTVYDARGNAIQRKDLVITGTSKFILYKVRDIHPLKNNKTTNLIQQKVFLMQITDSHGMLLKKQSQKHTEGAFWNPERSVFIAENLVKIDKPFAQNVIDNWTRLKNMM
tara:strand:+ start:1471 stop:1809 length:339 start_codon:yes stop_codon:yes gene_type:complete